MMINSDERWYYIDRARASRELAEVAATSKAAAIHMELQSIYLAKADETPLTLVT